MSEVSDWKPGPKVASFGCFLVHKVSHHGTLCLYQDCLTFAFESGDDQEAQRVPYDSITEVLVESRLARAMNNVEIRIRDSPSLLLTGLHEAEAVKTIVTLAQDHKKEARPSYGFVKSAKKMKGKVVEWEELPDPILMASACLPAPLATVLQTIEAREPYYSFLGEMGDEDIQMGEWQQRNGYRERIVTYDKIIIIPVLGKNLIKMIEKHQLFQWENRFSVRVVSDLGKTPYCKYFDPRCQLCFAANGDKTDFVVKFQVIWSGEPFVKSIIQNKTVTETKAQYAKYLLKLSKEFGGGVESEDTEAEGQAANEGGKDEFGKTRKAYKIAIIALIAILLFCIWFKHGRQRGFRMPPRGWMTLLVIHLFFVFLIFL
jgi:hypothetical protein